MKGLGGPPKPHTMKTSQAYSTDHTGCQPFLFSYGSFVHFRHSPLPGLALIRWPHQILSTLRSGQPCLASPPPLPPEVMGICTHLRTLHLFSNNQIIFFLTTDFKNRKERKPIIRPLQHNHCCCFSLFPSFYTCFLRSNAFAYV